MPSSMPSLTAAVLVGGAAAVLAHVPGAEAKGRHALAARAGSRGAGYRSSLFSGCGRGLAAQKDEPRGAVDALVRSGKSGGRRQILRRRDLDHSQRVGGEPAGGGERRQAPARQARCDRAGRETRRAQAKAARGGRVASPATIWARSSSPSAATLRRSAASASRSVLDEGGGAGAARQGFEAEGAGAGEGVEHRPVGKREARGGKIAVRQDVEQRLAGAVAGRPHGLARRRDEPPAAMDAADDAQPGRLRRSRAVSRSVSGAVCGQKNAYLTMNSRASTVIEGPASANRPDSSLTAT